MPMGGWQSCLPSEFRRRPRDESYAADVKLEDMPKTFDCSLVEAVSEATKLSRGKARKAVLRGEVRVNGEVVRDPDARVSRDDQVACGGEGPFERR
jgi:hypothetical protein